MDGTRCPAFLTKSLTGVNRGGRWICHAGGGPVRALTGPN